MHKKILAICAALVALAVVPAAASASPVLTDTAGKAVSVGSKITATNDESIVFTGSNGVNVTCAHSEMTGTVHANTGTLIEGTIEGATFTGTGGGKCSSNGLGEVTVTIPALKDQGGTGHWCIKTTKTTHQWELQGRACTSTAAQTLTFILHTAVGECIYDRTTSVVGTFTTNVVPATLAMTGEPEFTRENSNVFCPSSGKLDAKYNLIDYKIS